MAGTFGTNVGQIAQPKSIYQELQQNVPNYGALTTTATNNIGNELSGNINPQTLQMLQNQAGTRGITSGMPGSGLNFETLLGNEGLTSQNLQHQGLTDYNTFTGTAGSQQTDPSLAFGVASQNAVDAAAPDPTAANTYAQYLFQKYLNPAGSTGGGQYGANQQGQFITPIGGVLPNSGGTTLPDYNAGI